MKKTAKTNRNSLKVSKLFEPKLGYLIAYVLGACNILMFALLVVFPLVNGEFGIMEVILILTCFLPILFLNIDIYRRTYYYIKGRTLYCRSSVFLKKVEVDKIASIVKANAPISGWRLALNQKGLIITYNRFDEIYISPRDPKAFCRHLKDMNPAIRIEGY